ncbi:MAG: hypothetical protein AAF086_08720 [Planctomycetota bacterium]
MSPTFRGGICFLFPLLVGVPNLAQAVQIIHDERTVGYTRIDGESYEATAEFGQAIQSIVFGDSAGIDYQTSNDEPRRFTSTSRLIHDSSIQTNERGGIDLYAVMGFQSSTRGTGLGDPAATASGGYDVTVSFDEPQRFSLTLDAVASGDEAALIAELLNETVSVQASGGAGWITWRFDEIAIDSGLDAVSRPNWNPFGPEDFLTNAGLADALGFGLVPAVYEGILEPGEYRFEVQLRGGADGEDAYVLSAFFLDFSSHALANMPGDANRDEVVNQGDLNTVLNNWGQSVDRRGSGDLTSDGVVDQSDLNAVLNHWGAQTSPDLRGINVPEPGLAVLLLAAGTLGLRRRKL